MKTKVIPQTERDIKSKTVRLQISNGIVIKVDEDKAYKIAELNWYKEKSKIRKIGVSGQGKRPTLGRFIVGDECSKKWVFHKNGDRSDFRRENLAASDEFKKSVRESRSGIMDGKVVYYIPVGDSDFTIVDEEDKEFADQYLWYNSFGYAVCPSKSSRMHRMIMNAKSGQEVDHVNGNRMDNRKCNLRICNHVQNSRNAPVKKCSKTGIKGVWFNTKSRTYNSQIRVDGKRLWLGSFTYIHQAAEAYRVAAKKHHGEFARLK